MENAGEFGSALVIALAPKSAVENADGQADPAELDLKADREAEHENHGSRRRSCGARTRTGRMRGCAAGVAAMGRSRLVTTAPRTIAISATSATKMAERWSQGLFSFHVRILSSSGPRRWQSLSGQDRHNPGGSRAPQREHHAEGEDDRVRSWWAGSCGALLAPYHRAHGDEDRREIDEAAGHPHQQAAQLLIALAIEPQVAGSYAGVESGGAEGQVRAQQVQHEAGAE